MGTYIDIKSFCRIMIMIGNSLRVLSFNSLFLLFGFISNLFLRLGSFRACKIGGSDKDDQIDLGDSPDMEPFGFDLQSESFHQYLFGFQFQTIEEKEEDYDERNPESEDSVIMKFQSFPGKASCGFLATPEEVSFTVKEMFVNQGDSQMVSDHGLETQQQQQQTVPPGEEDVSCENREVHKWDETLSSSRESKARPFFQFDQERKVSVFSGRTPFPVLDSSVSDEENDLDFLEKISDLVKILENDNKRNKAENFNAKNQEFLEELIDKEIPFTAEDEDEDDDDEDDDDEEEGYINIELHKERKSKENNTFERWDFDNKEGEDEDEDEDGFKDILMQHRVMVEQMKTDAKNSRSGRLATIMEECETMKMTNDLKPLRLDERLDHKDHMNEIQKVYRSYTEKMKKLDILNYQTVHAISFLQMKDPSSSSHRDPTLKSPVVCTIKTLLFPSMWPCRLRRIYSADPTVKSIAELHRDLETVYLGQACLSWEILQWQYDKTKELLLNDTDSHRSYDHVVCEFQQFQVLVQRFVENEAFQEGGGSRVENYARNRCSLRTILQVPAIKDDSLIKNKMLENRGGGDEKKISIATLIDVIEETMRSFWEFIRADKDDAMMISSYKGSGAGALQKDEMELLNLLKATLQKKEKSVKGIVKSGNCIVRRFQKQKEGTEKDECTRTLIAQVELKLVGRVMSKARLTQDQLIWCQKKLNKLTVINRNIQIEPSFLLFPF